MPLEEKVRLKYLCSAAGTPVICSDIGVATELVAHGKVGLRYRPDDPERLAARIHEYLQLPPEKQASFRQAARLEYETYTAGQNYDMLLAIYGRAIDNATVRRTTRSNAAASGRKRMTSG